MDVADGEMIPAKQNACTSATSLLQVEIAAGEVKQKEEAVAAREAALAKREVEARTAEADAQQRQSSVEAQETELKAKQLDAKELQVCAAACANLFTSVAVVALVQGWNSGDTASGPNSWTPRSCRWCAVPFELAHKHCSPLGCQARTYPHGCQGLLQSSQLRVKDCNSAVSSSQKSQNGC